MPKLKNLIGIYACLSILAACTTGTSAVLNTFDLISRPPPSPQPPDTPGVRFLKVTVDERSVFMALGYLESSSNGSTEIWYSAKGEVLKLRQGRIVGTAGLTNDWRDVEMPDVPDWSRVGKTPIIFVRIRDVMPGYRFNIRENIALRQIDAPESPSGLDSPTLRWFEEQVVPTSPTDETLPPAQFAVDMKDDQLIPVYGHQCLAPTLCLAWQRL